MAQRRRDRCGEPFQDNFTENTGAVREKINDAQAHLRPDPDINSQESDSLNKSFAENLRNNKP